MKRFFSEIDPDKKSSILKYTGIAVLVFALFTLLSSVSYLFTWQADQSLLTDPEMMAKGTDVENWGGKLGYRWSRFLVSGCFGLGSFALVFLMGAVAYRLFFWNRHIGLLRTSFITVSGAFLFSLLFAYISMCFGADTFFGGGLGGDAGSAVIEWMMNLVGAIITALVLIVLTVAWMIVSNRKFAGWFALAGEAYEKDAVVEEAFEEDEVETVFEEPTECEPVFEDPFESELDLETESEPELQPVTVQEPEPFVDFEPEVVAEPEVTPEPVAQNNPEFLEYPQIP